MKEKSSKLSQIVESENQIDKDGRIFLDFDGDVFVHVLNYLRNGSIPPKERVLQVHECAEHFGISSLVEILNSYCPVARKIKISEMKKTFFQYDELKRLAVAELSTNFQTNVDKYFVFGNSLINASTRNGTTYIHTSDINIKIHTLFFGNLQVQQVVYFPGDDVDMIKCLGHELCELGFGKFSFYESVALYLHDSINKASPLHIIVLTEKRPKHTRLDIMNSE